MDKKYTLHFYVEATILIIILNTLLFTLHYDKITTRLSIQKRNNNNNNNNATV
jgi:uncharacterized membrane protein